MKNQIIGTWLVVTAEDNLDLHVALTRRMIIKALKPRQFNYVNKAGLDHLLLFNISTEQST